MNTWALSRLLREHAPKICNVMFHAPSSYLYACDCVDICKWPPRGNADAQPILIDFFFKRKILHYKKNNDSHKDERAI